MGGEQLGHDDLDALLMGKLDGFSGHPAKGVDDVGGLFFVPPTEGFNLESKGLQGRLSALDLDLVSAVRQRERQRAVDEDFHSMKAISRKKRRTPSLMIISIADNPRIEI